MLIVLIFKSSGALAAAYGIAVTGVMVIDTFHVALVAARQWHWGIALVVGVFGVLGADRRDHSCCPTSLKIVARRLAAARHRGAACSS